MSGMNKPKKHAEGGRISGYTSSDSVPAMLSRGEAYVSRAQYEAIGAATIRALNGGDTHVYVFETDGSVTDTEAED